MNLKHYYHMYADGYWQAPFDEHLEALESSGLIEALDFIGVGIAGCPDNIEKVKEHLPSNFTVVSEDAGWEQVTLRAIDTSEPAFILYAHTKGAARPAGNQAPWRRQMTSGLVGQWERCVGVLSKGVDVLGCLQRDDPWRHFSGNFWWATADYLKTLPPLSYADRWQAESWVCSGASGGVLADVTTDQTAIRKFGRQFIPERPDQFGQCFFDIDNVDEFRVNDEFVEFPPNQGQKIIQRLLIQGVKFEIKGNTIKVVGQRSA